MSVRSESLVKMGSGIGLLAMSKNRPGDDSVIDLEHHREMLKDMIGISKGLKRLHTFKTGVL